MQQKMGLTKEQKTSTLINMSEKSKYIQIKKKKISLDDAVSKAMNKEEKTPYITKKKTGPYITRKDPVDRKAQGGRAGYSKGGGVRKIAKGCGAVMRKKKTLYI
jgi:hypothetical protein